MTDNTLVIIGNGMAANRVIEELGDQHPFSAIHILSDEAVAHYNRIMLSPLLAGETTLAAITPHDDDWYRQHRVQIHLNTPAERIDTASRQVICSNGERFPYQALMIATGSRSFIPDLPGTQADNVIGFRNMRDLDTMLASLPQLQHATVIGAGLLGVEAAAGLNAHGVNVTLLHRNPVLMNRQLDATAAAILQQELQRRGMDIRTAASPLALHSRERRVHAIDIRQHGETTTLETGLVIFATGIVPDKDIAQASAIDCQRGILVDQQMRTSADHVYALGECCEFAGQTYGLVAPIWDQARVLAAQLRAEYGNASPGNEHYYERTHLTKLKVSGVDMHSIGEFDAVPDEHTDVLTLLDQYDGIYKKLVIRNKRIAGVLCVGDVSDSHWYYQLMSEQTDISALRTNLLFGRRYCDVA
ncbi:MAG: FAD-dependent oxidoreductase [Pseudomonadota bacterium]|nr:FAD-dependent oxidoreductase [Pseudomonadota bacterium]